MGMTQPTTQGASGLVAGVGAAAAGLIGYGVSLTGHTLPGDQVAELAFLITVAVHYFFGPAPGSVHLPPTAATGVDPGVTVQK